ncbi:MAG: LacI family transcriptional regulator [Spirochaetaceae bacterium]|jgi:DNA-binding LacI/PurR family transcriptional regulator|nr:LacI family transcriptional regulator [Spirochaetaceae bacterium]
MIKPTLQQIAEVLAISPATVSKALSGKPEVNEYTRNRVLACAQELGYTAGPGGSAQRIRRTAILIEDPEPNESCNTFYYDILIGFKRYGAAKGLETLILPLTATPTQGKKSYDDYLRAKHIDGVFISGLKKGDAYIAALETTQIPTVVLDFSCANPRVGRIGVDNVLGARIGVEHLIELGHRKIGFLNGHGAAPVSDERLAGYTAALCRRGIGFRPELVFEGDYREESGIAGADYFIGAGVTGLFCASDLMAVGAMRRFQERGFEVPGDISIVGFDNMPFGAFCTPRLTTVAQDRIGLGVAACALLQGLMSDSPLKHCVLPPALTLRESTKQARVGPLG